MRVVAFTKYDREAAATRQRFMQYAPSLADAGIALECRPLLSDAYVRSLATREHWSRTALLGSYTRRLIDLIRGPCADLVWVHAELFPYLPWIFEKLITRWRTPVIYDCDDAYFLPYNENSNPLLRKLLSGKVERLIGVAAAATCGNNYLQAYASRFCSRTLLFPTVVDTKAYRPASTISDQLTIGWIGSPSTWVNVRPLLPLLQRLCANGSVRVRAVGAGVEAERDRFTGLELVRWSEQGEVAEVQGFDIGIMPLLDRPFQQGKSAYKLVQYMACGIPAIAAPVGANRTVLSPECGLLATTEAEWENALLQLISKPQVRRRLGAAGRARAVEFFSLQAHAPRLVDLFKSFRPPSQQFV